MNGDIYQTVNFRQRFVRTLYIEKINYLVYVNSSCSNDLRKKIKIEIPARSINVLDEDLVNDFMMINF